MQSILIASDRDGQVFFDEQDIRKVCRIMRCGDALDECIRLMRKRSMQCTLCYCVLKMFNKPFTKVSA